MTDTTLTEPCDCSKEYGPCDAHGMLDVACDACGALPREACNPGCTALVSILNGIEDATDAACEHSSCKLLRAVLAGEARTVEHGRVMVGNCEAGQIADRSWATFAGERVERWSGFAGGAHVGDFPTRDIAAHAVREYAERASSGFRSALHG